MPLTAKKNEWVRRVLGVEATTPDATQARFEEGLFLKNALDALADYIAIRDKTVSLPALDAQLSRAEGFVVDWQKPGALPRSPEAVARMEDLALRISLERSSLDEVTAALVRIGEQLDAARDSTGGAIPDEMHDKVLEQLKDLAA